MSATCTWDVFATLDAYGSFDPPADWGGYWSKWSPELLLEHQATVVDTRQPTVGPGSGSAEAFPRSRRRARAGSSGFCGDRVSVVVRAPRVSRSQCGTAASVAAVRAHQGQVSSREVSPVPVAAESPLAQVS
jgi:hypothetical protein